MSDRLLIFLLLSVHFLSDFILQSDWMAKNKSKSNEALLAHTTMYCLPFWAIFGWKYALVNMALHTVIDYGTSRVNSYLWSKGKVHEFFVGVGFDQLLHAGCLIGTMGLINR